MCEVLALSHLDDLEVKRVGHHRDAEYRRDDHHEPHRVVRRERRWQQGGATEAVDERYRHLTHHEEQERVPHLLAVVTSLKTEQTEQLYIQ